MQRIVIESKMNQSNVSEEKFYAVFNYESTRNLIFVAKNKILDQLYDDFCGKISIKQIMKKQEFIKMTICPKYKDNEEAYQLLRRYTYEEILKSTNNLCDHITFYDGRQLLYFNKYDSYAVYMEVFLRYLDGEFKNIVL